MNVPTGYQPTQVPLTPQGQPIVQGQPVVHQAPPYGPPQSQPQPQPQAWTPPQMQQSPGGSGLSPDTVLDGQHVPPELRGRKLSEALKLYTALADDFVRRNRTNNQPQGQQSQGQQQPQNRNNSQNQGQGQGQGQQDADFWQNPDERITQVVQRVVGEAVRPFQQQALSTGIQTTMQQVRGEIPDFHDLEPEIMEIVKGSSPEALANKEYWHHAADLARGRRLRSQQQQPQQQQSQPSVFGPRSVPAPQQIQQPQQPQPQQQTGVPTGSGYATRPPTHQFFTEAPTAPSPYQNTHAGSLTPQEQQVADMAGVPHDVYAAWKAANAAGGAHG